MGWFIANFIFQCLCLSSWYINRKELSYKINFVALVVFITLLFEVIAAYLWLVLDKNNIFLFHILIPIQFVLFVVPYYLSTRIFRVKIFICVSISIVFISAIFFALTLQPVNIYNTYTQLLAYIFLTMWAATFLWELLNDDTMISIECEPLFWVSIGIVFYAVTNFVITGALNYLIEHTLRWARILYSVTTIVAFMMYIMFAFSFFSHKVFKYKY